MIGGPAVVPDFHQLAAVDQAIQGSFDGAVRDFRPDPTVNRGYGRAGIPLQIFENQRFQPVRCQTPERRPLVQPGLFQQIRWNKVAGRLGAASRVDEAKVNQPVDPTPCFGRGIQFEQIGQLDCQKAFRGCEKPQGYLLPLAEGKLPVCLCKKADDAGMQDAPWHHDMNRITSTSPPFSQR